jgi:hypothetical protein
MTPQHLRTVVGVALRNGKEMFFKDGDRWSLTG